jgi:hypothetical protein
VAAGVMARVARRAGMEVPVEVAANASGGPASALKRAARRVPADLYIAHYIAALPAAEAAARRHGGIMGFDAEDFHSGEGTSGAEEEFRMAMVEAVERACLPFCRHMTAAAPLIGQAYAQRYGRSPATVLNVFPLSMAPPTADNAPLHEAGILRTYWFSQTIGLDRGLQSFLRGMASAQARVTLDIRGGNRWGHGDALMSLAGELGIGDRVKLLPIAAPDEMVKLAAAYDLGLSLETDISENRRLCLTNKVFTYLLAGVPAMMSDTPAQIALAPDLGAAATVVSLADPAAIGRTLDRLANSTEQLANAKAAAWQLGRARYNWDFEKQVLISSVEAAFAREGARP